MPSRSARKARASPVSDSEGQAPITRLSSQDLELLEQFKKQFPNLRPEFSGKPINSFMIFRSRYVADKKPGSHTDQKLGNQTGQSQYSREAAAEWNYNTSDSAKEEYRRWSSLLRVFWKKMHPHGRRASSIPKDKKKNTAKGAVSKAKKARSSFSSRKFQPLPSPPVSDDAYFKEETEEDIKGEFVDNISEEDTCGDDDDEYLPPKPSLKSSSTPHRPWSQKRPKAELLTPVSITREISLDSESRSLSPTPAFCGSDSSYPSSPVVHDVNLSELNDDGHSALTGLLTLPTCSLPEASSSHVLGESLEQIAVGYSLEEHTNNPIMDWIPTDLLSDFDPAIHPTDSSNPVMIFADDLNGHHNLGLRFTDSSTSDF